MREFAAPGATADGAEDAQESDEAGSETLARTPASSRRPWRQQCFGSPAESQEFIETHENEAARARSGRRRARSRLRRLHSRFASERGSDLNVALLSHLFCPANRFRNMAALRQSRQRSRHSRHPRRVRPASTYKPATLIESPIVWDGSGLLPGESLSRHRNRSLKPDAESGLERSSRKADFAPEADNGSADEIEEEDFVEELTSANRPRPSLRG